jgi:hypothetical protein
MRFVEVATAVARSPEQEVEGEYQALRTLEALTASSITPDCMPPRTTG